jgi:hypothetical protein
MRTVVEVTEMEDMTEMAVTTEMAVMTEIREVIGMEDTGRKESSHRC